MDVSCRCGSHRPGTYPTLGCLECGTPCCPACAVPLESVTYCRRCATSLLEPLSVEAPGSFELH